MTLASRTEARRFITLVDTLYDLKVPGLYNNSAVGLVQLYNTCPHACTHTHTHMHTCTYIHLNTRNKKKHARTYTLNLKVKVVCSAEVPAQELFRPDVENTHHHELMDDLGIVKVGKPSLSHDEGCLCVIAHGCACMLCIVYVQFCIHTHVFGSNTTMLASRTRQTLKPAYSLERRRFLHLKGRSPGWLKCRVKPTGRPSLEQQLLYENKCKWFDVYIWRRDFIYLFILETQ